MVTREKGNYSKILRIPNHQSPITKKGGDVTSLDGGRNEGGDSFSKDVNRVGES